MTDEEIEILKALIESGRNVWMQDDGKVLIKILAFQSDYIGPEGGISEPVVWTDSSLPNAVGAPSKLHCFALWNSEPSRFVVLEQVIPLTEIVGN